VYAADPAAAQPTSDFHLSANYAFPASKVGIDDQSYVQALNLWNDIPTLKERYEAINTSIAPGQSSTQLQHHFYRGPYLCLDYWQHPALVTPTAYSVPHIALVSKRFVGLSAWSALHSTCPLFSPGT
jgi:hypothetical protein